MQQSGAGVDERAQLSERVWSFAQRGVVLLVAMPRAVIKTASPKPTRRASGNS